MKIPYQYRWPLCCALLIHVVLVIILFLQISPSSYRLPGPQGQQPVIQAQTLNAAHVQQMVDQIQHEQHQQTAQLQHQVEQLRNQKNLLKSQQVDAEKQLLQIREEHRRIQQQRLDQEKMLLQQRHQSQLLAEKLKKAQMDELKAEAAHQKALQQAKKQAMQKKQIVAQKQLMKDQEKLEQSMDLQQLSKEQNHLKQAQTQAQAEQAQGEIDQYRAMIVAKVQNEWVLPSGLAPGLSAQILVQVAPGGVVVKVELLTSSGNSALDHSATTAIYKASPLPVPQNPALFDKFRELRFTATPKSLS